MTTFYTYMLFSSSKNRFYIGSSADLEKRLLQHNAGATPSTKAGRPWIIVYYEKHDTKTDAIKREIIIKKQKSRSYIQNLINRSKQ